MHFVSIYNRNLLCRTLRTVVSGNSNFRAAIRMDFTGERLNACLTLSMFSADVLDRPFLTASNTHPVSINFLCHRRIEERDDGSFPYLVLYLRWIRTFDFVSINQDTHWSLGLLLRSNYLIRVYLTHSWNT